MTDSKGSRNLWPQLPTLEKGPVIILKEQARWLQKGTNDLIHGWITPVSFEHSGDEIETKHSISHLFYLRVPVLDDYLYKLFTIRQEGDAHYPLALYPNEEILTDIEKDIKGKGLLLQGTLIPINDEEQLLQVLESVFAANRTQELIANLLGQVQG